MKKRMLVLVMILALLLSAVACAGSKDGGYFAAAAPAAPAAEAPAAPRPEPAGMYDMATAEEEAYDMKGAGEWGENTTQAAAEAKNAYSGHKIIKTADLGIETREFETTIAAVTDKVNALGGYIANSETNGRRPEKYGDSGRWAYLRLRIPQDSMESFIESTKGLGVVTYENTGGQDVTYEYYDTESRLEIYQAQRERILELMTQADSIEAMIALETELSRITYEIESLTGDLKRWDDLVSFSTVTLNIQEIAPVSAVADDDSFGTRVGEGFMSTLSGIGVFFENLAVYIIAALPVLLLLGAIAWIIIAIIRANRRKKGLLPPKGNKAAQYTAAQPAAEPKPEAENAPEKKD